MALSLVAIILICIGSVAATSILLVTAAFFARRLHFSQPVDVESNKRAANRETKVIATPIVTGPLETTPAMPPVNAVPAPPPPPPLPTVGAQDSAPKTRPSGPAPSPKMHQLTDGEAGATWGGHSQHGTPKPPAYSNSPHASQHGSYDGHGHTRKASNDSYPPEKQEQRQAMYDRFGGPGAPRYPTPAATYGGRHEPEPDSYDRSRHAAPALNSYNSRTERDAHRQDSYDRSRNASHERLPAPSRHATPAMSERSRNGAPIGVLFGGRLEQEPIRQDSYDRSAPSSRYATPASHMRQSSFDRTATPPRHATPASYNEPSRQASYDRRENSTPPVRQYNPAAYTHSPQGSYDRAPPRYAAPVETGRYDEYSRRGEYDGYRSGRDGEYELETYGSGARREEYGRTAHYVASPYGSSSDEDDLYTTPANHGGYYGGIGSAR